MKKIIISLCFCILSQCLFASEWNVLFNQKDFTGWHGKNPHKHVRLKGDKLKAYKSQEQDETKAHWKVQDGVIYNDGHGPYLTTNKEYESIELELEVKMIEKSDSGIYLRGSPQVQLWDTREEAGYWKHGANKGSGGLWNNKIHTEGRNPLKHADNPIGSWNKIKVEQLGSRTSVWVNGTLVVDHVIMDNYWSKSGAPLPAKGPIMLQTHGAPVYWKNIRVKELSNEEVMARLSEKSKQSNWKNITPTASSMSDWKSTVNKPFELVDGIVRGGEGNYYYAKQQFSNYKMAFQFKLKSGANNGLLVRYPGTGTCAYVGLCELQILDNTSEKYTKLDDRQFHGSAYGIKAAAKGYLNPLGEWNHQIVTVKDRNIIVELNGYEILNADLDSIDTFMANKKHPGYQNTKGFVGFAGHRVPYVDFKDIRVKEIK